MLCCRWYEYSRINLEIIKKINASTWENIQEDVIGFQLPEELKLTILGNLTLVRDLNAKGKVSLKNSRKKIFQKWNTSDLIFIYTKNIFITFTVWASLAVGIIPPSSH